MHCAPPGWRASRVRIGLDLAASGHAALDGCALDRRRFALLDAGAARSWPGLSTLGGSHRQEVDGGASAKNFATLERVLRGLVQAGVARDAVLVGIGGGAVCDLAGLAAALCLRGIELVLVPTTLLAMVDASVGGKAAIDLPEGKNLVGAFWPASDVLIDPSFATTLPDAEYRSGMAEVLKVAIGLDAALFEFCEHDAEALLARDEAALCRAIELAVAAKIRVVERDPQERGERRLLNLGHTLGHALEARSGFTQPHGLAVAQGLHHTLGLAESLGAISARDAARCRALLIRHRLPPEPLPPAALLLEFVERDKKLLEGRLRAILPTGIGASRPAVMGAREFLGLA